MGDAAVNTTYTRLSRLAVCRRARVIGIMVMGQVTKDHHLGGCGLELKLGLGRTDGMGPLFGLRPGRPSAFRHQFNDK